MCDETVYVSNTVSIKLNDKKATCKMDNEIFYSYFISEYIAINNCYYLLVLHKILLITKKVI